MSADLGRRRHLAQSATLYDAARSVHRALEQEVKTCVGELWWPDENGALRCVVLTVEPSLDEGEVRRSFTNRTFAPGEGLIGRAYEGGRAEWISAFQDATAFVRKEAAVALGLVSGLALPVVAGEQVIGVISVYAANRLMASDATLRSLGGIGRSLGELHRRREVELEVRSSERRKAAILDAALDAVITMDHRGAILEFNHAAQTIFGHHRRQAIGRDMAELIIPKHLRGAHRRGLARFLDTGEARMQGRRLELEALHADGHLFPVEVVITHIEGDGHPVFIGFVRDITQQKQARDALEASERRFRETFDVAAVGIAHMGLDGRWLRVNDRVLQITGYPRQALLELTFQDITHPDDLAEDEQRVAQLLAGEIESYTLEKRYIRRDGELTWVQLTVSLSRAPDGAPEYFVAVIEDISERRAATANTAMLASIVSGSSDAILSKDLETRITSWNPGAERLYGYTAEEVLGQPVSMLCPEDRRHEPKEIVERLLRGEPVQAFETVRQRKDGSLVPVSLMVSPITTPDGQMFAASTIARDITPQKEAEERLRQADRQKDEFIAMLGHELRNPLSAMRTAAALLERRGPEPEVLRKTQEVLHRQTAHMGRLLDGLLDVSRIVRGKIELHRAPVDLGALVRQVVRDATVPDGLHVEAALPDRPVWVHGDSVRLTQVVDNLLTNALKYTPPPGRVTLRVREEAGTARLEVQDTGQGIEPHLLPYIFDVFWQGRQGMDRPAGGLGLGLALVKALTELHGGSVEARSEGRGRGATLVVKLPTIPAPELDAPAEPRTEPGPRRVLIVEDNEDAATLLAELLRAVGHEAETAATGEEGAAKVDEMRPDVVLCDLGLPGIDGLEVARMVRQAHPTDGPVLIAISGYGRPADKQRAAEAGFDTHLTKPVDIDVLIDVLRTLRR